MPVQGERNMRPSSPAGFGRQGVTATEQDSNSSSQEAMSVLPSPRWVTAWVSEVGLRLGPELRWEDLTLWQSLD